MALTISNGSGGVGIRCIHPANGSRTPLFSGRRFVTFSHSARTTLHVASAAKKLSSRIGKFDSKRRRSLVTTKEEQDEYEYVDDDGVKRTVEDDDDDGRFEVDANLPPMPELPGQEPGFWEGPQWDTLGFVVEYLWAFGIVFSLIACVVAVATYNEGATDFKDTPVYKESIQSRELLEEPEASNSDIFEANPTEVAPSLE